MRHLLFLLLLFLPSVSSAAVSINEIAWMGSESSANHEWIEIYNSGSATDVSGWSISDGMSLEIKLEGIIPASSYVVLERTSEASSPASAFLIYTGALVNAGATLKLYRSDNGLEDQVSGGEDWVNVGGDNTTKETAQYTDSGWVTAVATPGEENQLLEVAVESDSEEVSKVTSVTSVPSSGSSGEAVELELPDVTLELEVKAQTVGYVNQSIDFEVKASGIGKNLINSLQYEWNFGDGSVVKNKEAVHSYSFPGTYVVAVYGGFKRQEQVARHEITILPVSLSLTMNKSGDVQVNNDSPYEVDLSRYTLKAGDSFEFPARTVILPNQTITIKKSQIKASSITMVGLYDQVGLLVSSILPEIIKNEDVHPVDESVSQEVVYVSKPTPLTSSIADSRESAGDNNFYFANEARAETLDSELTQANLAAVNSAKFKGEESLNFTYIALVAIMLLGILGVYVKPRSN